MITVDERLASVRFERYGLDAYETFLKAKLLPESQLDYDWESDSYTLTTPARFAPLLGAAVQTIERPDVDLAASLFDFQRFIVGRALDAHRYACWVDTGLGKTRIQLEFGRQVVARTGGKMLFTAPLQVIPQTLEEARLVYGDDLDVQPLDSREDVARWCASPGEGLAITNPEKFIGGVMPELRHLAGFSLDEASLLKASGGVIKWNLIKSTKGIEYKLASTATPAPNDTMEYASQARFLEKLRTDGDVLWTYFSKDGRTGRWYVKPYATEAFYRFMASWSIYMRDPAHFGFADILSTLPPPDLREYRLDLTAEQERALRAIQVEGGLGLFSHNRLGVRERSKLSQLAKGFVYGAPRAHGNAPLQGRAEAVPSLKPAFVGDLVREDVRDGRQCLVWTVFDEESAILERELRGATFTVATLNGATPEKDRLEILQRFRHGDVNVLISKASLVGYGMNFQFCRSMVFSGFDDSFERMYQAQRRCVRYGQNETVRIHVPIVPELEGMIFDNLRSKESAFLRDVEIQERLYREALGMVG